MWLCLMSSGFILFVSLPLEQSRVGDLLLCQKALQWSLGSKHGGLGGGFSQ